MKFGYSFIFLILIINNINSQNKFPYLKGPYLGQKPPGFIPELFAADIVSINGRYEYGISFSPDLDEIYFSANKEGDVASIYFTKLKENKWTSIKKVKFTRDEKAGEMEPFVNHSGKEIYFTAYNKDYTDTKIWRVERLKNGWSKAIKLNSPLNNAEVFNSTLAKNGDLFFTNIYKSKTYYSPLKNGKYSEIKEINIDFGIHGFISPSQDYLLVDAVNKEDDSRKDKDIYVYFKQKNGTWSKPIHLGDEVNSSFYETIPSVTPDGKYLFFSRYNEKGGILSNFYWVSAEIIHNLKKMHIRE